LNVIVILAVVAAPLAALAVWVWRDELAPQYVERAPGRHRRRESPIARLRYYLEACGHPLRARLRRPPWNSCEGPTHNRSGNQSLGDDPNDVP
jgi:hypothetical protein